MDTSLPAREIIKAIVGSDLAPALKQAGFSKTALTFTRRVGSTGQFIQIQLSSWNQGSVGSFYVNVGVMFDQLWRGDNALPVHPKYDDCQFVARLERLAPEAPAQWPVAADTPIHEVSKKLTTHVSGIVERLDQVASLSDFESTGWVTALPWGFPAVYAYPLGRDEEAAQLIANEAEFFKDRGVTREFLIQRYGFSRLQC